MAEYYTENPHDALLRIDKPGPGVAAFGAFSCGGPSMVALDFYLYGDHAAAPVAHETPRLGRVVSKTFPDANRAGQERITAWLETSLLVTGRFHVPREIKSTSISG